MATKLVVLGIPWDVDTDGLKQYMSKFGELEDVIVMKERSTGRSRGFGYVTFSSAEDAKNALEAEHVLGNRMLEVKVATPKEEMRAPSKKITRIFVARIPHSVTEETFRSYFETYGEITDLYMPKDQGSKGHRGIGFITFESADSVDTLMADTHELGGSTLVVDFPNHSLLVSDLSALIRLNSIERLRSIIFKSFGSLLYCKKMVVIEPASNSVEEESVQGRANARIPEASLTPTEEGFETASDGEGGSDNEDGPPPPTATSRDDSYEDALNDEQLKQKALTQANDAKEEGNKLFRAGQYEDALQQYELALQLAPEMTLSMEIRSICHANSAACFSKLERYDDTIKECTKALELNPTYTKALVRRGETHEKLEHFEEAIADMKKILELDPSNVQARRAIQQLEPLAAEKREKMKEEMIGKLKEMGNSLLGRFGMSVDNFKAVKDPNTGSYSISFQR